MDNKKIASQLLKVAKALAIAKDDDEFDVSDLPGAIVDMLGEGILSDGNKFLKQFGFKGFKFVGGVNTTGGPKFDVAIQDNNGKEYTFIITVKKK